MKAVRILLVLVLIFSAANAWSQSLDWQKTYQAALDKAKQGNKCIFVFVGGSEWCEASRRYKKEVIDSSQLSQAIGSRVVAFAIDVPDWGTSVPQEENKKKLYDEMVARNKGFDFPLREFYAYPLVVLLDSENRHLMIEANLGRTLTAISHSPKKQIDDPQSKLTTQGLITRVNEAFALKEKRDAILAKAASAQGDEKAKYLAEALDLLGRGRAGGRHSHAPLMAELKKLDPSDKYGAQRRLTYNMDLFFEAEVNALLKDKKPDEAIALVNKEINDPRNDTELKQQFLARRFGVQQSQKQTENAIATLNEMIAIDKTTHMARLAQGYLEHLQKQKK